MRPLLAACLAPLLMGGLLVLASPAAAQTDPHAGHQQSTTSDTPATPSQKSGDAASQDTLPDFIPPITNEDRRAAFPDVSGHTVHDTAWNYFVLFDQFEWRGGRGDDGVDVDAKGWLGRDSDRVWFRADGAFADGRVGDVRAHVLYGRQVAPWWDVVAGLRQDVRPGDADTWVAFGIQGLAPYWFEIEATGYIGASWRTQLDVDVEYELLLTNRLIAQPFVDVAFQGRSDFEQLTGAGLTTTDIGFRLRYELKREVAPYVGIVWNRKWGQTAEYAESAGEETGGARFVTGLRVWF